MIAVRAVQGALPHTRYELMHRYERELIHFFKQNGFSVGCIRLIELPKLSEPEYIRFGVRTKIHIIT